MIISAGALFKSEKTNRFFFVLRSHDTSYPCKWSLCGGKIHADEHILQGLSREITEEIGFMPTIKKWFPFNFFVSNDKKFNYHSIFVLTEDEFIPKLNHENDGYAWVDIDHPPYPLHPRLKDVLSSKILIESLKKFN